VPASFVRQELSRRQQAAAFVQPRPVNVRSSALNVGQRVSLIKGKWQLGVVSVVCREPHSYIIRLTDGRLFRRTRWDINIDNTTRPTAVQSPMQPSRPQFSRGPVVVPHTQPPVLIQPNERSAVAVQPAVARTCPSNLSSCYYNSLSFHYSYFHYSLFVRLFFISPTHCSFIFVQVLIVRSCWCIVHILVLRMDSICLCLIWGYC
jgi:hypothetical protein